MLAKHKTSDLSPLFMMAENVSWRLMLLTLWEPWYLMYLACTLLPSTVISIIRGRNLEKSLNWAAVRNAWFANLWAILGPMFAQDGDPILGPLVGRAKGVVLDIGPGGGDWVRLFKSGRAEGEASGITRIYGVEPNSSLHARLRLKVKEAGLSDVYEVVGAGVEDLGDLGLGIEWESIDTIVTVQVMSSVPQPTALIRQLYRYLKPGGTWIMWEHVRTHEKGWIRWYQALVNMFWPHFFHGCSLTRPTDETVKSVGDWERVEISIPEGQNRYMAVPGILGHFSKRSA